MVKTEEIWKGCITAPFLYARGWFLALKKSRLSNITFLSNNIFGLLPVMQ
jgi:hypothetical protein